MVSSSRILKDLPSRRKDTEKDRRPTRQQCYLFPLKGEFPVKSEILWSLGSKHGDGTGEVGSMRFGVQVVNYSLDVEEKIPSREYEKVSNQKGRIEL